MNFWPVARHPPSRRIFARRNNWVVERLGLGYETPGKWSRIYRQVNLLSASLAAVGGASDFGESGSACSDVFNMDQHEIVNSFAFSGKGDRQRCAMAKTILHLVKCAWATANDLYLGIDTGYVAGGNDLRQPQAKHGDGTEYQAVDYWNIRKAIRILALGPRDVFYDLGCGKGRIVCSAARFRLRRVVGIELSRTLCDRADRNARRLRGRKSPIEILCQDAATADLSDGTVYFMFNPFGNDTLRDVLANIANSIKVNPRPIVITYFNPKGAELLDACDWLTRAHEFTNMTGGKVLSWRTRS
jgi:precorrin-6B methylase 2